MFEHFTWFLSRRLSWEVGFWASQNLNPPSRFPGAPAPWRDASQLQPGSLGRLSDRAVPVLAPRFSGQSRDNGSKELLGQRRHTLREAGRHRHGAHSLHLGAGGEKEGRAGISVRNRWSALSESWGRKHERQRCSREYLTHMCLWYTEGKTKLVLSAVSSESLWTF